MMTEMNRMQTVVVDVKNSEGRGKAALAEPEEPRGQIFATSYRRLMTAATAATNFDVAPGIQLYANSYAALVGLFRKYVCTRQYFLQNY